MARRDVELVIKAKDDAAKVVDAVTAAINRFVESQEDLKGQGKKTNSTLASLGSSLLDLDKTLRGMSGAERLTKELERATKAVDAQKKALADTQSEYSQLQQRLTQTAQRTNGLRESMGKLDAALQKQNGALAKAKEGHALLGAELRKADSDQAKFAAAQIRLGQRLVDQEKKLADLQARHQQLGAAMAASEKPTRQMQRALEASVKAIDAQKAKISETSAQMATAASAQLQAATAAKTLGEQVKASEVALGAQANAIKKGAQELSGLKTAIREAEKEEKQLNAAIDQTEASVQQLQAGIIRSDAAMEKFAASTAEAEAAMAKLAAEARGPLTQALRAQQSIVSQINNVYQGNRTQLAALSAEMGRLGVPTKEMVETYNRLNQVQAEVRDEYARQQAALKALGQALNADLTDTKQLEAVQRQFATTLADSGQALNKLAADTEKAAAANQKLLASGRQAASAQQGVSNAVRASGAASASAASNTSRLAQAYRSLYGESRQAMSWTQRLRGEVLSLISAYAGVYGVIELLGQTVDAYKTLEAAQSRLGALYNGDEKKVGQELDFLRRNADRLGIEFGQLADEYTKFAASTKGTNLEGAETRRIFISVAEAARVNKLSFEDLQGVFKALTQVASKGKVQLEELTGQFGDRLPGALQIMADGLGITTAELLDMTKEGELTAEALSNFANELDKRSGGQLAKSLLTATTLMGRLQNAVFQALLEFGKAGFLDGFNVLLQDIIDTLKDSDFKEFASNVSAAFGVLAQAIGLGIKNFRLLTMVVVAFTGIKLVPVVAALGASMVGYARNTRAAYTAQKSVNTLFAASAGPITGTTRALIGLRAAITGITASTGVGLIITAIAAGIGYWITEADDATEAMDRHRDMVDRVKNAYEAAGGKVDEWAEKLKVVSAIEANKDLREQEQILRDIRDEASGIGDAFGADTTGTVDAVNAAVKAFKEGSISAQEFRTRIGEISKADPKLNLEYVEGLDELAASAIEAEERVAEAKATLNAVKGVATEADKATLGLANTLGDNTAKGFDAASKGAEEFQSALEGIKEFIPELANELGKLKDEMKLREFIGQLGFNNITPEVLQLINRAQGSIDAKYTNFEAQYTASRGTASGAELERIVAGAAKAAAQLGVSAKDLLTAISYETGGKFDPNVMGGAGGQYYGLFQAGPAARERYGLTTTSSIEQQLDAMVKYLSDAGVKAGDGLLQIYAAINAGSASKINASDAANGGAPGTVLDKVSGQMDGHKARADGLLAAYAGVAELATETAKTEKERAESAAKYHETMQEQLTLDQQELALKDQDLVKREQAKAISQAELEAKKAGTELSQAERDAILANVEAKYREQAAQEAVNATKERAQNAEEVVNSLLTRRQELMNQMQMYQQQGDTASYQSAASEVENINVQLEQAISNAIAMWEAVGGPQSEAAIAKLRTASIEAQNFSAAGQQAKFDWGQVADMIGNHLLNAFDEFAQAVANGEDVGEAALRAFQKFAAQVLIDLGKMILQQMIFNALRGIMGGLGLGTGAPAGVGLFHSGKKPGQAMSNRSRRIDPNVFATAPRFHSGLAAPGLNSNEMAAILEKNEEVLTKDDPRHFSNLGKGGGGGQTKQEIRIINAIDSGDFVSEGVNSPVGSQAIINFMRRNKSTLKEVLS